ncbi:ABC transporter substrate-binding protein [Labrenzia sp. PHM005]|uniref:substrate-binding periplasmic protein n=1 Tax=Labrenzia sp. PHM005 TaxID=2590016 RepID=UPI0011400829|nr:transporter substrate-binding domain-containing protein [Labrenzia sp. PHM005]QDG75079.1 amino acid ABC transporter substrate-binding protein [Labrenzia sp. PHM005]
MNYVKTAPQRTLIKTISSKLAVSIAAGGLLASFTGSADAADTIRITNGEWQPFMSEYSFQYGANSHVISEAFKAEGITVEWGFFPWKRAFESTKSCNDWHASATWWPTEETKESFHLGDAISETSFVLFYQKGKQFDWADFNDLAGLKVGVTLGYDYGADLTALLDDKRVKADSAAEDETSYKKLAAGRIDVFPNDPTVGYAQIRAALDPADAAKITHHPKEFEASTLHLIVSKKCENADHFVDKFNSGLAKLKESGRFDQIMKDLANGKYDRQESIWTN